MTHEQQAADFLQQVSAHQDKLIAYAIHLAKDNDEGHDLYHDTLLKCRERIVSGGFNGYGYIPYLIAAIKLNLYRARRDKRNMVSISERWDQYADLVEVYGEDTTGNPCFSRRNKGFSGAKDDLIRYLVTGDEQTTVDAEEILNSIRAFIAAHYTADENACFDLHLKGQSYREIAFLTPYTYKQAFDLVKRMKKELQEVFSRRL